MSQLDAEIQVRIRTFSELLSLLADEDEGFLHALTAELQRRRERRSRPPLHLVRNHYPPAGQPTRPGTPGPARSPSGAPHLWATPGKA